MNPLIALGSVEWTLSDKEWRKLVFHRWKIIYSIRGPIIVVGRVWPCAMAEINFTRPLQD